MPTQPVIVNFGHLADAAGGSEAVYSAALASTAGGDDVERALIEASLSKALSELELAQIDPSVLAAPDNRWASLLQSAVAEHAADLGDLHELRSGGLEVRFDSRDRRWIRSLFGLIKDKLNVGNFDFLPPPVEATPLPNTARVAVLGDWGTGLYGAPHCAEAIERDPAGFQALVHLGDVYYSGTKEEMQERFHTFWPTVTGAINRACNSNHEMYSGGRPYAEITLPRFAQSSSLWWLESDHWVLLGLDTAYDEFDIGDGRLAWLELLTERARANNKRVIFFSHHQLFSHFKEQGHKIAGRLSTILREQRVFAWYWGHEHICTIHDEHEAWKLRGRCIGHSGFPYGRPDVHDAPIESKAAGEVSWHRYEGHDMTPTGLVLDGPNRWVAGEEKKFGPNGYAVLELENEHLTESVCSPEGEVLYRAQLV